MIKRKPFLLKYYLFKSCVWENHQTQCPHCWRDCFNDEIIATTEPTQRFNDIEYLVEWTNAVRCWWCWLGVLIHDSN